MDQRPSPPSEPADTGEYEHAADRADAAAAVRANHHLWEGWTEMHIPSEFYDVEGFKRGRDTLDAVELEGVLGAAGDVRGKSLLHLQCHFGLDTLSWARRGARVAGVDFSETAVACARTLAAEVGLAADFVCADVTDTAAVVAALGGRQFDVVFTSHGVLSWLPELRSWARTVAATLRPGGVFFLNDAHPFTWLVDDETAGPEIRLKYDYFDRAPLTFAERGSYAAPGGEFEGTSNSWQHPFEEVIGSLLDAGLRLTSLREHPYLFWRWFSWMIEDAEGRFWLPDSLPQVPLMFSLTATRPTSS